MRLIIAGSRDFSLACGQIAEIVRRHGLTPTLLISGGCRGVDRCGETWAAATGIPVTYFAPDWDRYGPAAGPIRNKIMALFAAEEPDSALLAFWDGRSSGTRSMIGEARRAGLRVYVEGVGVEPVIPERA